MKGHTEGGRFHPHSNTRSGINDKFFKELEKKSAEHYLGYDIGKQKFKQSDVVKMAKIFNEEEKKGHIMTKKEMLERLVEEGLPVATAIDLVAKTQENKSTGKIDMSLGWYQGQSDAYKRIK